jgi:hypothetical protein
LSQKGLDRAKAPAHNSSMNNVGYARISTDDQTLALQLDALQAARCKRRAASGGLRGHS